MDVKEYIESGIVELYAMGNLSSTERMEFEQRLLGTLKVDPADLVQLADARVKRVLAWLLDTAKADSARVFEVNTGQAKGAVVTFALK